MIKLIQILNCEELQYHYVLKFVFNEFANAMVEDYGCKLIEVNKSENLEDDGIILMGNYFNNLSNDFIKNKLTKFTKAIFLGWYWHDILEVSNIKNFIHISEDKGRPINDNIRVFNFFKSVKNYTPLLLRANENPLKVGTYKRNVTMDYCFMGYTYCAEMVPTKYKGLYLAMADQTKYLSYNERRDIYLSSKYALGFHAEIANEDESVSQRVFEGMAYGCLVLTNSITAEKMTDGIAVYVKDKNDLESKMDYYNNHEDEYLQKQNSGYEWVKKLGTNRLSWQKIFDKIEELHYNIP